MYDYDNTQKLLNLAGANSFCDCLEEQDCERSEDYYESHQSLAFLQPV